ncbi:FAD-dependent monooxygenase [Nocardia donostiensis]|uniref:FAD-binding domain-containing protein n=1 Tax=Nocardia donostiensis TaxID=1538463 RepID=A0A1V2TLK6_9NOCA|nr:FAD-dependent monooxygenase [Nocardia donostiensis]ONM50231.1 hypothetical protein B0T46_03910 [Nocardia donostiensis]OQS15892.1 hypothetical protein B0T36_08005 [Nocardia donostiensis]OQS23699.1 hypothetical protein B0T44_02445 [Nocardia donostiensis]
MQVLIVGAGPIGLPLATTLSRRGIAVRVIEAAESLFAAGAQPGLAAAMAQMTAADRRRIADALPARLADFGVAVDLDTTLLSLEQDETGVTAVLARSGGTETARFSYLIGADDGRDLVWRSIAHSRARPGVPAGRVILADDPGQPNRMSPMVVQPSTESTAKPQNTTAR